MISHAFLFSLPKYQLQLQFGVAFCAFTLHHKRVLCTRQNHQKYNKEMCLTFLATVDERYNTENVELDSSLCITRSIIYALSEPQMVLRKSQRKNLRPSFQQNFFFLLLWMRIYGSENVHLAQISYQTISLFTFRVVVL